MSDIVTVKKGRKPSEIIYENMPGYRRLIQIDDLRPGAITKYCPPSYYEVSVEPSDIVIAWDGANAGTSNFGLIGVLGSTLAALRPIRSDIDTGYLGQFVRSKTIFLRETCKGATVPHIDGRVLSSIEVPLPPLPEQRRIAHILDQANEMRAKRQEAMTSLESLAYFVFLDMFGDPRTNPNEWQMLPFAEVCPTHLGKMLDAKQQTGKYQRPYVRNINIQWLYLDLSNVAEMDFPPDTRSKYRLMDGDLLICEGGEPGRAAIWHGDIEECYFQKAVHRGRPIQGVATAEYLVMLLWFFAKRGLLADHITSATIAHLTGEKLKKMLIPVPPLALQKHFSQLLGAIQDKSALQNSSASELDRLFDTLQYRAFRGEL